jgi:hypothetical protein
MLEKHQLKILSDAVSEVWKNINFTKVNEHNPTQSRDERCRPSMRRSSGLRIVAD